MDITVSKLSRLQKRVLVYALQRMLAKEQRIEAATCVTLCTHAPPWLNKALSEAMGAITKARKGYVLNHGETKVFLTALHPWMQPFEEMIFLRDQIKKAAREAEVERSISLHELYQLAFPTEFLLNLGYKFKGRAHYFPRPYIDHGGWCFQIGVEGASLDEVKAELTEYPDIWAYDDGGGPANCTIPELLRDLFGFQVSGPLDAQAFSINEIGVRRYNAAQASLRRACRRLQARGLIHVFFGQRHSAGVFNEQFHYQRSRIGLTAAGVAVADGLLQADNQAAWRDLNLAAETPHERASP